MTNQKDDMFTPKQKDVITASVDNILVSAAAGSGKTTVLVIRKIVSHDISISEILVVTFTKAAASNMQKKIEEALREAIVNNQGDIKYLKEQLDLLPSAYIQTIDSFCSRVLKEKGYELIGKDESAKWHFGSLGEPIADDLDKKNGLFEAFKQGNTKTVVFGHDHVNNLCISYDGIKMLFNLGLAYNSYTRRNNSFRAICDDIWYGMDNSLCEYIDGATDYIIENNKEVQIASVYNQFNGTLNGLEEKLRQVSHYFLTYNAAWLCISLRILMPLASAGAIVYYVFFIKENRRKKTKKTK